MVCQLCKKDKNLIRAHIIPKSFYSYVFPNSEGRMISKNQYLQRIPIGVYDSKILCEECEQIFSTWDDYGNKFFHTEINVPSETLRKDDKDIGHIFTNINYINLKLFLISVLWRANVSTQSFFEEISLGPFENILREMILASNAGNADDFTTIISKFNYENNRILHSPQKVKYVDGINAYRLFFFNSEVHIKVDNRIMSDYRKLMLTPGEPLIVSLKNLPDIIRVINQH